MSILSAHAIWVVAILFAGLSIGAVGFAVWPLWRGWDPAAAARIWLTLAIAAFVLGVGGGAYLTIGAPELAWRAIAPADAGGLPGLIAQLSVRLRHVPGDVTGWTWLGRGYLTLDNPEQAAVAFHHASEIASARQRPELLSAYGEALTLADGRVTPEAEAAFDAVLAARPKDFAARFYLGQAYVDRHDPRGVALWRSLLADAPANAPWRTILVDRMAALQATRGGAPDIGAMVRGLAARLRAQPEDIQGWQRLVRAYVVLGQSGTAHTALTAARMAMRGQAKNLAALDDEARTLGLEK